MHLAVNIGGIPHLAKNERDTGHPSLVREREADPCETEFVNGVLTQTLKAVPFRRMSFSAAAMSGLDKQPKTKRPKRCGTVLILPS
jgi:hypothetical protein